MPTGNRNGRPPADPSYRGRYRPPPSRDGQPLARPLNGARLKFQAPVLLKRYELTRTKREFTKMKKAPIQQFNTQDQQLNEARKEGKVVTIRFLDGNELAGLVSAFDQFCISFLVPNPMMDLLIYKHSIVYIKFPQ
jgi:RNA chaperone Hfq